MKKLMMIAGVVTTLGVISQLVESSLDEAAVKQYVVANFEEQDEADALIDLESDEKLETTFLEKLGF